MKPAARAPYTFEPDVPLPGKPAPLDIGRVTDSLKLAKVNGAPFLIPAAELVGENGRFLSTGLGQRIHQAARRLGLRVVTKKCDDGLRVWRVK